MYVDDSSPVLFFPPDILVLRVVTNFSLAASLHPAASPDTGGATEMDE